MQWDITFSTPNYVSWQPAKILSHVPPAPCGYQAKLHMCSGGTASRGEIKNVAFRILSEIAVPIFIQFVPEPA